MNFIEKIIELVMLIALIYGLTFLLIKDQQTNFLMNTFSKLLKKRKEHG